MKKLIMLVILMAILPVISRAYDGWPCDRLLQEAPPDPCFIDKYRPDGDTRSVEKLTQDLITAGIIDCFCTDFPAPPAPGQTTSCKCRIGVMGWYEKGKTNVNIVSVYIKGDITAPTCSYHTMDDRGRNSNTFKYAMLQAINYLGGYTTSTGKYVEPGLQIKGPQSTSDYYVYAATCWERRILDWEVVGIDIKSAPNLIDYKQAIVSLGTGLGKSSESDEVLGGPTDPTGPFDPGPYIPRFLYRYIKCNTQFCCKHHITVNWVLDAGAVPGKETYSIRTKTYGFKDIYGKTTNITYFDAGCLDDVTNPPPPACDNAGTCRPMCDEFRFLFPDGKSKSNGVKYNSLKHVEEMPDKSQGMQLNIIPNPTAGIFRFSVNGLEEGTYVLRISSSTGNALMEVKLGKTTGIVDKEINLSSYSNGVYYYRLLTEDGIVKANGFINVVK